MLPPASVWWSHFVGFSSPLRHELREFYARIPAIIALCISAGADPTLLTPTFKSALRLDVVVPDLEESQAVV